MLEPVVRQHPQDGPVALAFAGLGLRVFDAAHQVEREGIGSNR